MPARVRLGDLEQALQDPAAYRRQMDIVADGSFGETYVGALRQAIFRYHKTQNREESLAYLEQRLQNSARLSNPTRIGETLEKLDWYTEEHQSRGWPTAQAGLRLVIPAPAGIASPPVCSGEVARIDLVPAGGYAGWLVSGDVGPGWERQLRFPLIQHALAVETFGVPVSEVSVGVYDLDRRLMDLRSYSQSDITDARQRFTNLWLALGFNSTPG